MNMESLKKEINQEKLKQLLDDFKALTGFKVSFFEEGKVHVSADEIKTCSFCERLRNYRNVIDKCIESDHYAMMRANRDNDVYLYKCHLGLFEAIVCVKVHDEIVGYLMYGQVRDANVDKSEMEKRLKKYHISKADIEESLESYEKMVSSNKQQLLAAARILKVLANHVVREEYVRVLEKRTFEKLNEYLNDNYLKSISLDEMSKDLHLNKTYMCQVYKKKTGRTIIDSLHELRIEKAKVLLLETNDRILEISKKVGYEDANYFSRVFKKITNMTPSEFRKI